MAFQINEKLKFHHTEITTSFGLSYVRGIPVDIHWILKQPAKYETFLRRVQDFVNLSLIGHGYFVGAVGCSIDEDGAEAEGLCADLSNSQKEARRDYWALVIPKGIGSLHSVNLSEIDLLDRVRMSIQIAQAMQLLSSSEEYQYIHVIPSLENIIIFKNTNQVKLDLQRENLLDLQPVTSDDLKNRIYGFGLVLYYLFRYTKSDSHPYTFTTIRQGTRPDLGQSDVPALFQSIIQACWSAEEDLSFEQLEQMIKDTAVKYFVGDEDSKPRKVWGDSLDNMTFSEWSDRVSQFVPITSTQLFVAKSILNYNRPKSESENSDQSELISIEQFSNFLTWFGPSLHYTIFDDMSELAAQNWFCGCFSSDEAITVLSNQPEMNQAFLLRLNLGKNSEVKRFPYTLSIAIDDFWSDDRLRLLILSNLCKISDFSLLPFHVLCKLAEYVSLMEHYDPSLGMKNSSRVYQSTHIYHLRIRFVDGMVLVPFFGVEEKEQVSSPAFLVQSLIKLIEKITNPNFEAIMIGKPCFTDEEVKMVSISRLAFSGEF